MPDILTVKALRERLRAPAAAIRLLADKINAENRDFTAEEQKNWEAVNTEYNALEARIQTMERAEAIEAKLSTPAGHPTAGREPWKKPDGGQITEQHKALAFSAWMRYQAGLDVDDEASEAAQLCGVNVRRQHFDFQRPAGWRQQQIWSQRGVIDFRAAIGHGPTVGGTTVSEGFVNNLEIALLQYGGVRNVAEIMTTTGGEPMPWPTANDTSNKGRRVSESGQLNDVDPAFGATIFNAYKYTSDIVKVPFELLEDSAFKLPEVIGGMLGIRIGRITNDEFTTGTGASQPRGIVTNATTGVTAASGTAIAADELFSLLHSIDPAYRMPGCGWMWHDNILLALRKLKDGLGRYLWQEGMSVGEPNRMLDWPYQINQSMDSTIASGKKTVLFGLLNKYKIRDVAGVRLRRLDERYADTDQVAFVALSRHDGNLVDAGTHPVKVLVHP